MENCVVITKKEYNELREKAESKELIITLNHFMRMVGNNWEIHYDCPRTSMPVSGRLRDFLYSATEYLVSRFNKELSDHLPEVAQAEADAKWSKRVTELETEVEHLKNRSLIARIFNK